MLDNKKISSLYKFSEFFPCFDWSEDYGKGKLQDGKIIEGLAILSQHRFSSEVTELPIQKNIDRWPRISVLHSFSDFTVCNLHLSKHEISRKVSVKKLPYADIYAGDFNMFPEEFMKNFPEYDNSYSFKRYISYPAKDQTLDYVLLKSGDIKDVRVIPLNFSDHNAIETYIII
ncbi:MAG: hypothetical protein ACLFNK_00905 [Candidatus Woesearchaeota archaeon]